MRPWRPPFHASSAARKGPISSKRVSSQDPFLRKFGNFSLYSLSIFTQILAHKPLWKFSAHKPPNLEFFSSQAPEVGNFSAHKPSDLEIFSSQAPKFGNCLLTSPPFQRQMSVRKPHTSEIRAAHPYLKKSWVPPPPRGNPTEQGLDFFHQKDSGEALWVRDVVAELNDHVISMK